MTGPLKSKTIQAPERRISLVVLGAGKPYAGSAPSALRLVDCDKKVLDWILHAFSSVDAETFFVGGYEIDEIVQCYPDIKFIVNSNWQNTGANGSLFLAPLDAASEVYVCYSDIVFRPELVHRFANLPPDVVAIAVDDVAATSRKHLANRARTNHEMLPVSGDTVLKTGSDAEFIGLARFPARVLADFAQRVARGESSLGRKHLSALITELSKGEIPVRTVSAAGLWSDLESDQDLTRFVFGTKAETLDRLAGRLKKGRVPPQYRFSVGRWQAQSDEVIAEILASLGKGPFAVRSSALTEDGFIASNAGQYCSVLHVLASKPALVSAVNDVITSYGDRRIDHQIFVQPMIRDVFASGVLLTRTLRIGGPYRTVAWSESEATDIVTSGKSENQNSVVISRSAQSSPHGPAWLDRLLDVGKEIEFLVGSDALDIEFAVDRSGEIHVLQVRPLVLDHERTGRTDDEVSQRLELAKHHYLSLVPSSGNQVGDKPVWGIMPDWNPAEIIGARPGHLAFDLYDFLICSDVWAQQRAEYGYRDVRPCSLLRLFAGFAYVDVRASFNSFVPAAVDDAAAAILVNAYLDHLRQQPELHDKIEFQIALTCWSFDFDKRIASLAGRCDLSKPAQEKLTQSLIDITRQGIARTETDLDSARAFEAELNGRKTNSGSIDDALALLYFCRRKGTLPFAHLARSAFVAMTLLKSAVLEGLIPQKRLDSFLRSIRTVSHKFMDDALLVRGGRQSFDEFVARYGHLRPGTYNILSPSYGEQPEKYLKPVVSRAHELASVPFAWTEDEMSALTKRLGKAGISICGEKLDRFFRNAIEGREYSKFVFTRALSSALDIFTNWGQSLGLAREDLADMSLADIHLISNGRLSASRGEIMPRIATARYRAKIDALVELPALLMNERDLYAFRQFVTEPNFVTDGVAVGRPRDLDGKFHDDDLDGVIVFIPNADPGFDWIFGHAIAGLVTVYGGVNSHMAIRAAEFGLPAAIGIGEVRFRKLRDAPRVELNCRERRIHAMEIL